MNKTTCVSRFFVLCLAITLISSWILLGCTPVTESLTPEHTLVEGHETSADMPLDIKIDFTAVRNELDLGECVMLEWTTQGGEVIQLNEQPVASSGQKQVCPSKTSTYTLAVYYGVGPPAPPKAKREIVISVSSAGKAISAPSTITPEKDLASPAINDVLVYRDLEYASYELNGLKYRLFLDLYQPEQLSQGSLPLLIFIHGGGWFENSKEDCPGNTFAKYGYAVACIDYRLGDPNGCPDVLTFPNQIHDVKAAVRWLRQNADHYRINPNRFGAFGDSSGGHLAALLGTSSSIKNLEGPQNLGFSDAVQAVSVWYGPVDVTQSPIVFDDNPCLSDIVQLNEKYGGEETPYFYWTLAWGTFLGGSLTDQAVLNRAAQASPLTYIGSDDPPFLIIQGKEDQMIPVGQSDLLVTALNAAGVDTIFVNPPGVGHGYLSGAGDDVMPEILQPTLSFFDQYLKRDE